MKEQAIPGVFYIIEYREKCRWTRNNTPIFINAHKIAGRVLTVQRSLEVDDDVPHLGLALTYQGTRLIIK